LRISLNQDTSAELAGVLSAVFAGDSRYRNSGLSHLGVGLRPNKAMTRAFTTPFLLKFGGGNPSPHEGKGILFSVAGERSPVDAMLTLWPSIVSFVFALVPY